MSYLNRINEADNADMTRYLPLYGFGRRIGWLRRDRISLLPVQDKLFTLPDNERVLLGDGNLPQDERVASDLSTRLDRFLRDLADRGLIDGWRDERYRISDGFTGRQFLSVERAAAPFLGIRSWGFHLDGYVRRPDGLYLWIARRAEDRPAYPGKRDNMVAGGQPADLSLGENLLKECREEAGLDAATARRARPCGVMAYRHETSAGLKPDVMFCYELELDAQFRPRNMDGEVAGFDLLPASEVMRLIRESDQFKFNSALSLIGFFLRHGLIDPDRTPDYAEICCGLTRGLMEDHAI